MSSGLQSFAYSGQLTPLVEVFNNIDRILYEITSEQ
jgi:hypothetical protein